MLAAGRVTGAVAATHDRVHKRRGGAVRHRRKGEARAEVEMKCHSGEVRDARVQTPDGAQNDREFIGSRVGEGECRSALLLLPGG